MSRSRNSRRGRQSYSGPAKTKLRKHLNHQDRAQAKRELRSDHDPLPKQPRGRVMWDLI